MNKDAILSVLRHILTFGGGYAAAKFGVEAGEIEGIIASIIALAGGIWGVIEKVNRPKV